MEVIVMRVAVVVVGLLLLAFPLFGQEALVTPELVGHPGLLVKTNVPGAFLEAPAVATDIALSVRGIVARGVVRQTFRNTTDHCIDAIYVFPLADDAAIDAMRMHLGVRTIEGEIRERDEAAAEYEQARSEGRGAALLEQHRPNLFTVSVASLPAGETAVIEIEYQQVVSYDDGRFSLRVPLAFGPRYRGDGKPAEVHHERTAAKPVTMTIDLDSGIELAMVKSATHAIDSVVLSATRVSVRPREVSIAADRDFELTWAPRLGHGVHSAQFTETVGNDAYTLVMLFPPDVDANPAAVRPREAIFIIDTSGSMGGPSIQQAKQALVTALRRLRASDRFNVIEFNSTARRLFDASRRADSGTVGEAVAWVEALQSTGGTEMLGGLALALTDAPTLPGEVRQVVFITDGQVGNEADVFAFIREHLGAARLFTIAIGSAPNTYFMRNAARAGRGTFTHIGDVGEVEERMTAMLRKLESPVKTNFALTFTGGEQWPNAIPDLYAGEPLVVTVKNANGSRLRADSVVAGESKGIAKVWARRKIDALRDSIFTGASLGEVKKEIVATALAHHLVTEETSLVAVDRTPPTVDARTCIAERIPVALPAGWGGIEGSLPQTGTNALLWILVGIGALTASLALRVHGHRS